MREAFAGWNLLAEGTTLNEDTTDPISAARRIGSRATHGGTIETENTALGDIAADTPGSVENDNLKDAPLAFRIALRPNRLKARDFIATIARSQIKDLPGNEGTLEALVKFEQATEADEIADLSYSLSKTIRYHSENVSNPVQSKTLLDTASAFKVTGAHIRSFASIYDAVSVINRAAQRVIEFKPGITAKAQALAC